MGGRFLDTIGLQVWSVRNQLAADAPGTLAALKAAGYAQVELLSISSAPDLVPLARRFGLGVSSSFSEWETLVAPDSREVPNIDRTVGLARDFGIRYLVFGYIGKGFRETVAQFRAHAQAANRLGRACAAAGIQLCYHHHSFEFLRLDAEGRTGWEILLQDCDPSLVKIEFDIFWSTIGGIDAATAMRHLGPRIAQVHLKDMAPVGTPIFCEMEVPPTAYTPLGKGFLDMPELLQICEEIGVDQCQVEQDHSPDPLGSARASIDYLRSTMAA